MHRIIASHLARFSKSFELEAAGAPTQFEHFVNYCCACSSASSRFEITELTTGDDDSGLDGIIIIIDDDIVTTPDDARQYFSSPKRSRDVMVVFTQSKSGESFQKSEIGAFGSAVANFLMEIPAVPLGERETEARAVFDVVIENVSKVRGGQPACKAYFATSGAWRGDDPILSGAFEQVESQIGGTELFGGVAVVPLDRHALVRMWTDSYEPVECVFRVLGFTPIPSMAGVTQAYVAVAPAKDFIDKVLESGDGRIRTSVFQENVRSFLGEENPVNAKIGATLLDEGLKNMFAALNNGITIVAPEVKIQSDLVSIRNFQIVNGCQTSHVLYRERESVDESVTLPLKVIESADPNVVARIVEATNSQSQIKSTQFFSLRQKVREIEDFFNTFEDDSKRIYFERREKQYAGLDIPNARIFDIEAVARAYAAMFLDVPHLSARYPKRLIEQMKGQLYQDNQRAEGYYAAAFAAYRWHSLHSNRVFPGNYSKYKYHMLMVMKYLILGDSVPSLGAKKMGSSALRIAAAVRKPSDDKLFKKCARVFEELGNPSRDKVTMQSYAQVLKSKALEVRGA